LAFSIEVARDSSFCPGVGRAIRIAEQTLSGAAGPVYSVGPLIHNPQVVAELRERGLRPLEPEAGTLPELNGVPVVVRSHGIDADTEGLLERSGARVVDATCPTVKRAQEAARRLHETGYHVVILGSPTHPEVRSIIGRIDVPVTVLESRDAAEHWLEGPGSHVNRVGIVCQTTISPKLLADVDALFEGRVPEVLACDTVCETVAVRQLEAVALAGRVDLVIVVGGRDSSNTARLTEICRESGAAVHQIEDASEIDPRWLEGIRAVGVTGGASTPGDAISQTVERLEELGGSSR